MLTTSAFAEAAALVGDPARANMLIALMDGRALTAKELAHAAGITAQTASVHLARLTDAAARWERSHVLPPVSRLERTPAAHRRSRWVGDLPDLLQPRLVAKNR
jgi:hypothetical protein